jgi:hypothetical protein
VHPNHSPFSEGGKDWVMSWTLMVNMVDGDMELASRIWNPMDLKYPIWILFLKLTAMQRRIVPGPVRDVSQTHWFRCCL